MKKHLPVISLLAVIAIISGYMIHKMSWVARLGIRWFYGQYAIFKSWGKTTLLEFALLLLLFALHSIIQKKAKPMFALRLHLAGIALALIGLYSTYNDFRHDLSHRIAGERFHIGFYLFWVGWIIIALKFLVGKNNTSSNQQ